MKKGRESKLFIFCCTAPAIILFTIFITLPTIDVFRMSMYKWGGYSPNKEFVGLQNFKILFEDENFFRAFQNTILVIVLVTLITIVFSLVFAAILTKIKMKCVGLFRVIFYIPNILSIVIIAAISSAVFDQTNGLLNGLIKIFAGPDFQGISFFGDPNIVMYTLISVLIWQAIGYYMVMYMSSMGAVPESLYEAADLEGASQVNQFFTITIPLIWTNIRTTLVFFVISSINLSFLLSKAVGIQLGGATDVLLRYMYDQASNSSYGYSMAVGVVVFCFAFALSGLISLATKRETIEF